MAAAAAAQTRTRGSAAASSTSTFCDVEGEPGGGTGGEVRVYAFPCIRQCARRKLDSDSDAFFTQGNIERAVLSGKSFQFQLTRNEEEERRREEEEEEEEEEELGNYAAGMYVCSACGRVLPTPHLLDIHINEAHSSYFAALAARGERVYECLLEECGARFKRCGT